jgi:hypothetical protein
VRANVLNVSAAIAEVDLYQRELIGEHDEAGVLVPRPLNAYLVDSVSVEVADHGQIVFKTKVE